MIQEAHSQVVQRAADAIQEYLAWKQMIEEPFREFHREYREIREQMKRELPLGADGRGILAEPYMDRLRAVQQERAEFVRRNPQPKTADKIVEEAAGGDPRLWTRLCNQVADEHLRRTEGELQTEGAA